MGATSTPGDHLTQLLCAEIVQGLLLHHHGSKYAKERGADKNLDWFMPQIQGFLVAPLG